MFNWNVPIKFKWGKNCSFEIELELPNQVLEVGCCSPNTMSFSLLKAKCLLAFQLLSANPEERNAFNNGKPSRGVCLLLKCLGH